MLKVYEQLKSGNYNLYVLRPKGTMTRLFWEKVNKSEITDFSKIDTDAISIREFLTEQFDKRDFKTIDGFVDFIQKNNY